MRAACRKFLTAAGPPGVSTRELAAEVGDPFSDPVTKSRLTADLGELRGVFGIHIARISAAYGIDVEEDLARILPEDSGIEDDELNTAPAGPYLRGSQRALRPGRGTER